jgi:subtilisin family serine protease
MLYSRRWRDRCVRILFEEGAVNAVRPCALTAVVLFVSVLLLMPQVSSAGSQPPLPAPGMPQISAALAHKIASGNLLRHLARTIAHAQTSSSARSAPSIMTAIYSAVAPSNDFLARLSSKGVRAFPTTWTPPSDTHPLGFFLALVPTPALGDVLALDAVKKMDTAECEALPQSNQAARAIKADLVWSMGLTGSGVKIGVIDSGLDISYAGNELPSTLQVRDYSLYPEIDTLVANTATGHGTHVTGIVLARGVNSLANIGNGGGAYKGMAPAAALAFLKIGIDGNGGASEAAEIAAIHAAVDTFHVKVINLSYGGWDTFHDGSSAVAQAIDWAYSKGVACFVAAGNFGNLGLHASGYAMARDTSAFIQVSVAAVPTVLQLAFNLVWYDGPANSDLSLLYYDSSKTLLTNVTHDATYESSRGTQSQFSQYNPSIVNQSGTYYLRVVNRSPMTQTFHVYENYGRGFVQFAYPDPKSTVSTPGDADGAFTVGAYSAHDDWTGADGGHYNTGMPLNTVPSFSSQGPRVDGPMKPNLIAPGCMVISLRDRDVLSAQTLYCVDDDGIAGGSADYYVMHGTSMASPVAAGAAALLLQQDPELTPQQIYDALMQNATADGSTGNVPNPMCGFGKLNVFASLQTIPLPVELASFASTVSGSAVVLTWHTAAEIKNYGFEIERNASLSMQSAAVDPNGWTRAGFVAGSGTSQAPHTYSFEDKLQPARTTAYRLKQIDNDGRFVYSRIIEVKAAGAPTVFSLAQNFPNPFNPSTTFRFSIPAPAEVRLTVFDVLGRKAAVILNRQMMESGPHEFAWNASGMPSGVYFYRLDAGAYHATKKLTIQK